MTYPYYILNSIYKTSCSMDDMTIFHCISDIVFSLYQTVYFQRFILLAITVCQKNVNGSLFRK